MALADLFAGVPVEVLSEAVNKVQQLVREGKGHCQMIDLGQHGWFHVYSAQPLEAREVETIRSRFAEQAPVDEKARGEKGKPQPAGLQEVKAWLLKVHTVEDYRRERAGQRRLVDDAAANSSRLPLRLRGISEALHRALIPEMKMDLVFKGKVPGDTSGLAREIGHTMWGHLTEGQRRTFRRWFIEAVAKGAERGVGLRGVTPEEAWTEAVVDVATKPGRVSPVLKRALRTVSLGGAPQGYTMEQADAIAAAANAEKKKADAERKKAEQVRKDAEKEQEKAEKLGYTLKDVQLYYDMQIAQGMTPPEGIARTKTKFKLSKVTVSPAGIIQAPEAPDPKPIPPAPEKKEPEQEPRSAAPRPGGGSSMAGGTFPQGPAGPAGPTGPKGPVAGPEAQLG